MQDIPWDEYEVICVDDCSPDGSRSIVERLQKEYPTLRLLTTFENLRQGGARNMGLDVAQGMYVWFVDSDDSINSNVLGKLLNIAEKNMLDILQFDYIRKDKILDERQLLSEIREGETYLFEDLLPQWIDKIVGPWRQLYNYNFLRKLNLRYIEKAAYEDTDFVLNTFLLAKKVQHISLTVYKYRINCDSVTLSDISPIKLAWQVNQVVRCCKLIDISQLVNAKKMIGEMVSNTLSHLRKNIKNFTIAEKFVYLKNLQKDIKKCRKYMSRRTWFAIRYGITYFIK